MTAQTRPSTSRRVNLFGSIRPYQRPWLSRDVVAGITLAALAIPEVMGYTKIAGTPVITGLYTILIPILAFAILGSSRHLVVGGDSATAAIMYAGIASLGIAGLEPYTSQWLALASLSALLAAGFLFLARLARLGFLANFISRTVLVGFLTGVGIQVALGQVGGMLGVPAPDGVGEPDVGHGDQVLGHAEGDRADIRRDARRLALRAGDPDRLRSLDQGDSRRARGRRRA